MARHSPKVNEPSVAEMPSEATGSDSPMLGGDLFVTYLESVLPQAYDFAYRLFRSERAAEQVIETALRAMLKAPAQCLSSREKFVVRLLGEIYLVAESTPEFPDGRGDEFDCLALGIPAAITPGIGSFIWRAATTLPLAEYSALHLQSRMKLTREMVAEVLGLTAAYTFILLGRAQRHFEDTLSTDLIRDWRPIGCQQLAQIISGDGGSTDLAIVEQHMLEHLATNCPVCRRYLSTFGETADLLGSLAPVTASGLLPRLRERLGERLTLFDESTGAATVVVPVAIPASLTGASTGAEPGLKQTRFTRFGQWWEEHNLTRTALITAGLLVVLVVVAAVVAFQPSRNRTSTVVDVLGLRPSTERTVDNEGSIIGRASTPTTGRLPEVAISEAPLRAVEEPSEEGLAPRLTATPQNRVTSGPVVILNPVPVGQTSVQAPALPAEAQPSPSATATPTATAVPTPLPPRLNVSSQSLSFASQDVAKTIILTNAGAGQVRWYVVSQQAWLLASPSGGVIGNGPTSLQIQIDRSLGGSGRRQGTLLLNSSTGNVVINVTAE